MNGVRAASKCVYYARRARISRFGADRNILRQRLPPDGQTDGSDRGCGRSWRDRSISDSGLLIKTAIAVVIRLAVIACNNTFRIGRGSVNNRTRDRSLTRTSFRDLLVKRNVEIIVGKPSLEQQKQLDGGGSTSRGKSAADIRCLCVFFHSKCVARNVWPWKWSSTSRSIRNVPTRWQISTS